MDSKKTVIITGGTGLLGTHLLLNKPENVQVVATVHEYKTVLDLPDVEYVDVDVRSKDEVEALVEKYQPYAVIHTAAHGRLDYCQKNQEDAHQTNVMSTQYFVDALKKINGKILFCSTNATFDGYHPPYNEESPQDPKNYYGQTKVMSEKYIRQSGVNYTIMRLMTMYGWNFQPQRKNMVSMLIEKLRKGEQLWMTNDVWNNMLYAKEAAKFFWQVILTPEKTDQQTFNIAGSERANRYETTMVACEVFELDKALVTEVDSDYFKGQEVPRAPDTCFDTSKAQEVMHFQPIDLKTGFGDMKDNSLPTKTKLLN